jgi:hypothetical protein
MREERIEGDLRGELKKLELHDLKSLIGGDDDGDDEQSNSSSGAAITDGEAAELTNTLKPLPRETVSAFLTKFGVQKIRELKTSDLKAARAFIDAAKPRGEAQEVDPFA